MNTFTYKNNVKRNEKIPQKGFTLIEVMVSVGLFLVVMTITLGAVMSIIDGNKKTQAINAVSNNLNSSLESMTRDIKTGYAYFCGETDVPLPSTSYSTGALSCGTTWATSVVDQDYIVFISTISGDKRSVKYSWRPDAVTGKGAIFKTLCPASKTSCTGGDYIEVPITSPDIDITSLNFRIHRPPAPSDTLGDTTESGQPSVFISITGKTNVNTANSQVSDFSIQTIVSQRVLNI